MLDIVRNGVMSARVRMSLIAMIFLRLEKYPLAGYAPVAMIFIKEA